MRLFLKKFFIPTPKYTFKYATRNLKVMKWLYSIKNFEKNDRDLHINAINSNNIVEIILFIFKINNSKKIL